MHYNNKEKFIFLHMPKTGGTFLDKFLKKIPNTHDDVFSPHNNIKSPDWHFGINESLKYITFPLNEYHVFTTTRNPFDMYVSLYEYTKRGNFHEWGIFKNSKKQDFASWLVNIVNLKQDPERLKKFENDHTSTSTWFKESHLAEGEIGWVTYRWLRTCNIINPTSGVLEERIDTYLKQENLNQDIAELFLNKLNVSSSLTQEVLNSNKINQTTGRKKYQDYYTSELIELVNKRDSHYLKKFNYSF